MTYSSSEFDNCIDYLQQLKIISLQYKEKMVFSIRFHSLNEIKRSKILLLLGLPNKSEMQLSWDSYFKIEKFIPCIKPSLKKRTKPMKSIRKKEIPHYNRNRLFPLLKSVRLPVFMRRKTNPDQEIKKESTIVLAMEQKEMENEGESILDSEKNTKEQGTIFPYGQVVSERKMKKLIKNIPPPPP